MIEVYLSIGFVITISMSLLYAKMIIIHRSMQLLIHGRRVNDWKKVNEFYLKVQKGNSGEIIKDVTYNQMRESIKLNHYGKTKTYY